MRVHIFGASGSGTTTLARHLAANLAVPHFDADDYYWERTEPPFTVKNPVPARQKRLLADLGPHPRWILSGSMVSWSEPFVPLFQLAVYLYVPADVRVTRLEIRERQRYGDRIAETGDLHRSHEEFITWAGQYDEGYLTGRSRAKHQDWIARLPCPVLRIEGNVPVGHAAGRVLEALAQLGLVAPRRT